MFLYIIFVCFSLDLCIVTYIILFVSMLCLCIIDTVYVWYCFALFTVFVNQFTLLVLRLDCLCLSNQTLFSILYTYKHVIYDDLSMKWLCAVLKNITYNLKINNLKIKITIIKGLLLISMEHIHINNITVSENCAHGLNLTNFYSWPKHMKESICLTINEMFIFGVGSSHPRRI